MKTIVSNCLYLCCILHVFIGYSQNNESRNSEQLKKSFREEMLNQKKNIPDTITWSHSQLIISLPRIHTTHQYSYDEGYSLSITNPLDSVFLTIHCGVMVALPLTILKNKQIISIFKLSNEMQVMRGYEIIKQNGKERKVYFREENYFKYGITVLYENVVESRLSFYDGLFDNIKVYRTDAK